jgi:glycosyltransferase involved in cell wall biosynthesis
LPELIADGKFGITIDNGDSNALSEFILQLNSHPQMAKQMGQLAREYLQSNFTPEIIAKQYIHVLRSSIKRNCSHDN